MALRMHDCFRPVWAAASAAAALATVAGPALADIDDCLPFRNMEPHEIRSELTGQELHGYSLRTKATWSERLHPDGVTEFRNAAGKLTTGRWRQSGKSICFSYGTMTEWTCKRVERAASRCNLFRYALIDEEGKVASAIIDATPVRHRRGDTIERLGGQTRHGTDVEAAIAREKSWDASVRMGVQNALVWSGDYKGRLDGDFGDLTRSAIRRFQSRLGVPATGYLTEQQINALEQIRVDAVRVAGFELVDDRETGIRVGLPLGMFRRTGVRDFMVVYEPSDGERDTVLALVSAEGRYNDLLALHSIVSDPEVAGDDPYSVVKQDWFVVAGSHNGVRSYAYAQTSDGTVKGFVLSWPEHADNRYRHLSIAMLNSFEPIPGRVLRPDAVRNDDRVARTTPDPQSKHRAKRRKGQAEPRRAEDPSPLGLEVSATGTGFVIDNDGGILTNAHVVEGCEAVTIGDGIGATIVSVDDDVDLALLRTDQTWPAIAKFAAGPARLNSDVTVIGYPLHGLLGGINVTRGAVSALAGLAGRTSEFQISAAVQPGNSGGPVVDATGAVVGVVRSKLNAVEVAGATGDIPQNINFAIRGEAAKLFLISNGVLYETSKSEDRMAPADLAEAAQDFTVLVNCLD